MALNKYIAVAISVLITMSSCEEIIEIDLNSSDPALVIEASLYKDSVSVVHLTKTANYFSIDEPAPIENASVTITTGNISEELSYIGNGNYIGQSIIGKEDINYNVEIVWNETEYTGSAYLPKQTEIISLEVVEFQPPSPHAPLFLQIESTFLDDPERENFYLLRYIQNDTILTGQYFAFSDLMAFNDTISFTNPMMSFDPGDEVVLKVFSIDEPLYNFFVQLNDALSGGMAMSSTPYNPTSNIEGAMGYFAAWSYDADTITIQ